MTDHICPATPCPRCRDEDDRRQAIIDQALGASLRSPQCMECRGHGRIILGHADSEIRSRGVVQCAECRYWFHTDCIIRHFETAAAKRIVALESENAGLKTAMEGHIVRLTDERDKVRAESAAEIAWLREALKEARDLVHAMKEARLPDDVTREGGDLVFGLVDIYGMEDDIKRWDAVLSKLSGGGAGT